ncbi:MAG: SEC-C metal-binding domain-containing protein [Armatimonadota bacterium]
MRRKIISVYFMRRKFCGHTNGKGCIMNEKRGYFELCLCGSGKVYENCCGKNEKTDCSVSANFQTGTVLDMYMPIFEVIAKYAQEIAQFDKDGEELIEAWDRFEKRFRPGEKNGVPDSLFMTWLFFDFRFGDTSETVCERFIKSSYFEKFEEPEQILIKNMASSYYAFYEAKGFLGDWIFWEELVTGKKWRVFCFEEEIKTNMMQGEIWFARYVGTPQEAYEYGTPFVFLPESKSDFMETMKKQENLFLEMEFGKKLPDNEIFRETCKFSTYFWAGYMMSSNPEFDEDIARISSAPALQETKPKSAVKKKIQSGEKKTACFTEEERSIDCLN